MGCLKLTYSADTSPLQVSREEKTEPAIWEVWTAEGGIKERPRSGDHWMDQFRTTEHNAAFMSTNGFRDMYGVNEMSEEDKFNFALSHGLTHQDNDFVVKALQAEGNNIYASGRVFYTVAGATLYSESGGAKGSIVIDPQFINAAYMKPKGLGFFMGFGDGFMGGLGSTWNFLKSLGTEEGWMSIYYNTALEIARNPTNPFVIIFDSEKVVGNIGTFVKGIPNMSAYELGYATGFGTEKLAEIALISKGAGLFGNAARGVNPFGLRGGYGVFGKNGLKIGNYKIEAMYANRGAGGTIFSAKQMKPGGALWRWDYGTLHGSTKMGLHSTVRFYWNGVKYGSTAQRTWYPSMWKAPFYKPLK